MTLRAPCVTRPIRAARAEVEAACRRPGVLGQHHPVWLDILTALGEHADGVAVFRGDALVAWLLAVAKRGPAGVVVTSLPFVSYGGPALLVDDEEAAATAVAWLEEFAAGHDAAAVGVGLSPFASTTALGAVEAACRVGGYRFENFAQVQPLDPHPIEQLSGKRRGAIARPVERATMAGVSAAPCDDPAVFERWLVIYRERYAQIGARPLDEAFHRETFERGRAAGVVEFWAATMGSRLLGGSLFLVGGDVVDYFSSAYDMNDEDTRLLTPNNLLLATAFRSFAARGLQWFNWQSSPGREGVYKYKARWGASERPQWYLGRVRPGPAADRLLGASPSTIVEEYPSRFVVPFSLLGPERHDDAHAS